MTLPREAAPAHAIDASPDVLRPAETRAASGASLIVDAIEADEAPSARAAWAAYVDRAPAATFFHRWEWGEAIARAYGYKSLRLVARRGRDIVGVLSLVDVRSPIFGRSLISTAFTVGGGALGDDAETLEALAAAARARGESLRVRYVELRGGEAAPEGWAVKSDIYAGFSKSMPRDEAARLSAVPRKRRAEVRKAMALMEEGRVTIRHGRDVDAFYSVYARAVRDLGTPVFPKVYPQALLDAFGEDAEIAIVEGDGAPVAALLTFYFRDRVLPYYVGAIGEARPLRAFDALYWEMMARGAARGADVFDFGRSKVGTPHFHYKTLWGFEPEPLNYYYALIGADETPNVNPNNPKFSAVSAAWKRLPTPIANLLGPALARNLA